MRFFIQFMAGVALAFGVFSPAHAQEDGDFTRFVLEANGYRADSFEIAITWQEQSRYGAPQLLHAARLAPKDGGEVFDLYWDAEGNLLDEAALRTLGIQPKDWSSKTVDKAPEIPFGFPKFQRERPTPRGVARSLNPKEYLLLPAPATLSSQETYTFEKAPYKIGDFAQLSQPVLLEGLAVTDGEWAELPDGGALWSLTFRSPGVTGQRIHFKEIALPIGVQLLVYNADDPKEVYGPLPPAQNHLSPMCFGAGVAVEIYVPAYADISQVRLEIDEVLHVTKAFEEAILKAGTCNNQVSCFEDWGLTASGVGLITFSGSLCTGSLLVDNNPNTSVPFFLTANHCISTQSRADTVEVFWLYQTNVCGGSVPALSSVPRTSGGAQYLVGSGNSSGTDVTLLRLNNAVPQGIAFLGYNTNPVALGEATVGIHHPQGEHKRISFGTITNEGSPSSSGNRLQPLSRYHEVLWNNGTTEPGSSGSAIFLPGTRQIIGQLWGGRASCSLPNEPDYYGRFDVSYPLLEPHIGAPPVVTSPFDLDGNGVVNAIDLQLAINAALGKNTSVDADFNMDGIVDAVDVQTIINVVLSPAR